MAYLDASLTRNDAPDCNQGLQAGTPYLKLLPPAGTRDQVVFRNAFDGEATFGVQNNFAPLASISVGPSNQAVFAGLRSLYFFASTPQSQPGQALALESAVGKLEVPTSGPVFVQLQTDGATVKWKISGGS